MSQHLFKGVHLVEVADDKIGFPAPFYKASRPEKTVVLAAAQNLLTGKTNLIGYQTKIWQFLETHLTALCDFPQVMPHAISEFLNSAVACPITAPPPREEDWIKNVQKTIAEEDYVLQVPHEMIRQANLGSQAVLAGHDYHFEVWTPRDWRHIRKRRRNENRKTLLLGGIPDIVA